MKIKVVDRNDAGIAVLVYDNNGIFVRSMNISFRDWNIKYRMTYDDAWMRKFDLK